MPRSLFYSALARAFLAGEASEEAVCTRVSTALGRRWRWIRPLVRRYLSTFGRGTRPRRKAVLRFLRADQGLTGARIRYGSQLQIAASLLSPNRMVPVAAAAGWKIPTIESLGALAEWLETPPDELAWFGDLKGLLPRRVPPVSPLAHYNYRVLTKNSGDIRLIESPKRRLKQIQRRILSGILEGIPAHPAAHGFVRKRSVLSFVSAHVGRRVVLRTDLRDFFPSIHGARVAAFFRTAGYPELVADVLAALCTNAAPARLWDSLRRAAPLEQVWDARALYCRPHLPQGAATSPALANLCTFRVDCRVSGLARAAGADYTRYADDMAFSGGRAFERAAPRFLARLGAILDEEGFTLNHRKTRLMREGVRQHLAGLVLNEHPNVDRRDFDALKALLTNCRRHGPESQNRDGHPAFRSHLEGRVAFVAQVNPLRGLKLRRILQEIVW